MSWESERLGDGYLDARLSRSGLRKEEEDTKAQASWLVTLSATYLSEASHGAGGLMVYVAGWLGGS